MSSTVTSERRRRDVGQILRFLVVGGSNTLVTYAIFVALGLIIPPWIAYTIAFAIGLVWVALGSSRFVFRAAFSLKRVAIFIGCNLVVYGLGQILIRLVQPDGLLELVLTSLLVLVVTAPVTFILGRYIFNRPASPNA
jgi:putative flippase GtrA